MLLNEIMEKKNNNLNFIRLWLAFAVIVGHTSVFISNPGPKPILSKLFPFTYCGNIAVIAFFFFSGLFVTNSLFEQKNVKKYLVSRFLRIYPPLFICLVLSAVICFWFSPLDLAAYSKLALKYITHNLSGFKAGIESVSFYRDGYPLDGKYATAINGSIWIIPYEIKMYILTLALFLLSGVSKKWGKYIVNFVLVIGIFSPFLFKDQLLGKDNMEMLYLIPSFSFGSLLALWKNEILFDWRIPLSLFLIGAVLHHHPVSHMLFFFALNASCLYLSTLKWIRKIPLKIDISYGVYIYGWFVQQLVQYFGFPYINWYSYVLICCVFASMMGIVSYYCVENPCSKLKQKINRLFTCNI